MLGQIRIGRYEVVSALERAAMGTVYKAIDPQTERAVAIKPIDRDFLHEERAECEERFYREVAARLSHANIVAIHDVGEADDIAYVAMEYLEGQTLRELLDRGVVLPLERVADIAAGAANALDYAHENDVVHGDIKPENILITSAHDVKIMNFGAAQIAAGSPTETGPVPEATGSPAYLAPEQLAGGNPDGRTDIFALAVVVYEMLTGVTPFTGDSPGALADKVLKEAPLPPSARNDRVPIVFDRIIGRALAKRPRDRYQTASAFARDLQDADAARRGAHEPEAGNATAIAASATGPGGRQGALVAVPPAPDARTTAKAAVLGRHTQRDAQRLLLVVPVVIAAALAIYLQGREPARDELAANEATPTSFAPPGGSPPPAPLTPAPVAAPPATSVPAPASVPPPSASAKPNVPAKTGRSAKPEGAASASAPPAVLATPRKATLALAVSPWGEVYVDGKRVGVSPPLSALQLEPGKHRVEIRNQTFEPYRDTVSLESGKPLKIKHKFR